MLLADAVHTLLQCALQRYERRDQQHRSSLLYYATLLPEISMQLGRLCHHLHVWYVHGLSISVISVLLLANTKAAFEALRQRVVTHRNFVRADANLKRRFRTADPDELHQLHDCCAICREKMDTAKVTAPTHYIARPLHHALTTPPLPCHTLTRLECPLTILLPSPYHPLTIPLPGAAVRPLFPLHVPTLVARAVQLVPDLPCVAHRNPRPIWIWRRLGCRRQPARGGRW